MKARRWGTREKPEKAWMGRPKRIRVAGGPRPPVIRRATA